jgi:hypothetical protein
MQKQLLQKQMKHLVFKIEDGWIKYHMGDQTGMHPLGDDLAFEVINYLVSIIKPTTYEIAK